MIKVYTDGSCQVSSGVGGIGIYFENEKKEIVQYSQKYKKTTNNRMELLAVIKAFSYMNNGDQQYTIFTDSQYVYKGITVWIHAWKQNNWQKKSNQTMIANVDLWKQLDELVLKNKHVQFDWVKAHKGNHGNEMADSLARKAMLLSDDNNNETIWQNTKQILESVIC